MTAEHWHEDRDHEAAHDHARGGHGGHAGHDHRAGANERSLKIAFALAFTFLIVELADGVPEDIDIERLEATLRAIPGVRSFHDLRVWSVTSGKTTLTVHLVIDGSIDGETQVLPVVRERLAKDFGLRHATVQ